MIDRIAGTLRDKGMYAMTPEALEAGMKTALASDADLSDWVAPQHDDAAVRRYLEGVLKALETRLPPNT